MVGGQVRAFQEVDFVQQAVGVTASILSGAVPVLSCIWERWFSGQFGWYWETSTSVQVRDDKGIGPGARAQPAGWSLGVAEPEGAEPQSKPPWCLRRRS